MKIHRFCWLALKILMRQNLVTTSSYGWGWSTPCEAIRTYKPSSFLAHLCNLSPCNSFYSHGEKHSSTWNQPHNTNQPFLQLKTGNSSTILHYFLFPFHSCKLHPFSCMEITYAPYWKMELLAHWKKHTTTNLNWRKFLYGNIIYIQHLI